MSGRKKLADLYPSSFCLLTEVPGGIYLTTQMYTKHVPERSGPLIGAFISYNWHIDFLIMSVTIKETIPN